MLETFHWNALIHWSMWNTVPISCSLDVGIAKWPIGYFLWSMVHGPKRFENHCFASRLFPENEFSTAVFQFLTLHCAFRQRIEMESDNDGSQSSDNGYFAPRFLCRKTGCLFNVGGLLLSCVEFTVISNG